MHKGTKEPHLNVQSLSHSQNTTGQLVIFKAERTYSKFYYIKIDIYHLFISCTMFWLPTVH